MPTDFIDQMHPYLDAGATVQIMLNMDGLTDPSTADRSSGLFSEVVEEAARAFRPAARPRSTEDPRSEGLGSTRVP